MGGREGDWLDEVTCTYMYMYYCTYIHTYMYCARGWMVGRVGRYTLNIATEARRLADFFLVSNYSIGSRGSMILVYVIYMHVERGFSIPP